MFRTASKSNLALGVALAVIMMCGVPSTHCMRVVGTQSDALTADNVDLFSKFIRRITGAESLNKEYQGYQTGRQEIMERRSYALGAGLAVLIITALGLWALTFYAWWRLRLIRRQGHGQVPIQPMMAPMIHAISPQPLPSGPKLVSQKVIGNAPPGFHPSPVRVH